MDLITDQQSWRSQGMTDRPLTLVLVSTPSGSSAVGAAVVLNSPSSVLKGLVGRGHACMWWLPPALISLHWMVRSPCTRRLAWISPAGSTPTVRPRCRSHWMGAAAALGSCSRARCRCRCSAQLRLRLAAALAHPPRGQSVFHLVSMGSVSSLMDRAIQDLARWDQRRMAFHTRRQASDFALPHPPEVVGNGFDLSRYGLQLSGDGPLGWAGRVAPEKGLEDAAAVAAALGEPLKVWGLVEDPPTPAAWKRRCLPARSSGVAFKPRRSCSDSWVVVVPSSTPRNGMRPTATWSSRPWPVVFPWSPTTVVALARSLNTV